MGDDVMERDIQKITDLFESRRALQRVCSGSNCCDTYCSNPNGACNDAAKTSCYASACDNTRDPWGNSIPSHLQSGCYGCDCSGKYDESTALDEESAVGQHPGATGQYCMMQRHIGCHQGSW